MLSAVVQALLAAVALGIATMLGGGAMLLLFGDLGIPPPETNPFLWQFGSWLVLASTLVWFGRRSAWTGWRRAAGLAILLFGISNFNSIIEARFFGLVSARQLYAILTMSALSAALFALALAPLLRRTPALQGSQPDWVLRFTAGRLAVGAFAYLFIYFAAGLLVLPFVEGFYLQRPMPSPFHVIAMQLLIRGPVFVALIALLVRMSGAARAETALMSGAALSLLGGVATLMVPNSFIPDAPRWAHFVEVATSNFLYGCFLGWLLTVRTAVSEAAAGATHPPVAP